MATLIIENVDLDLLDKQRLELVGLSLGERSVNDCPGLEGIIEMLDAWSDRRAADGDDVSK